MENSRDYELVVVNISYIRFNIQYTLHNKPVIVTCIHELKLILKKKRNNDH